jgi:fatty-acyl-CoA synthase
LPRQDATTCGVTVPGADGGAGVAAILVDQRFDLKTLSEHLMQRPPPFAHPVFVRISDVLDATETFKQKKRQLIRDGFDPASNNDMLYYRDPISATYRGLEAEDFSNIARGIIRL